MTDATPSAPSSSAAPPATAAGTATTVLEQTAVASGADAFQLERELNRLWAELTHQAAEQQIDVMRSSVLNLVVYLTAPDFEARVQDTLAHLAGTHPSRTIVVAPGPGPAGTPASGLDAWITTSCRLANGRHVCSEQIRIEARGAAIRAVPSIVIPLLIPELPTVLWWVGDLPGDDTVVRDVSAYADTLIVDSADFAQGAGGVRRLAELRGVLGARIDLADLNWTRTLPWRELTAACFDPPEYLPALPQIDHVSLELGRRADGPMRSQSRALLLVAWLATRLGWTPAGGVDFGQGDRWSLRFTASAGRSVEVTITAHPDADGGLAGVRSLTLAVGSGDAGPRFCVERADDDAAGTTRIDWPGRPTQTRASGMQFSTLADLLAEELAQPGRDRVFEAALPLAAGLVSEPSAASHQPSGDAKRTP